MSRGQKLLLQSLVVAREFNAGEAVWARGSPMLYIVLLVKGSLHFDDLSTVSICFSTAATLSLNACGSELYCQLLV
jgi:hypothetical protein